MPQIVWMYVFNRNNLTWGQPTFVNEIVDPYKSTITAIEADEPDVSNSVEIYPNPLEGKKLTIDVHGLKGKANAKFYNVNGGLILEYIIPEGKTPLYISIEPGQYVIQLTNEQETVTKKLL